MKSPAFQLYPGDIQRDTALRSCSLLARGLWFEILLIMHDGTPRGYLKAGDKNITPEMLATMIGAKKKDVIFGLKELEISQVFSRNSEGIIYNRRMIRDEEIRKKRASGGIKSLENTNVPRKKEENKGTLKGYHEGHLQGPPEGPTGVPSPAFASATAIIKTTSSNLIVNRNTKCKLPDSFVVTDDHRKLAKQNGWPSPDEEIDAFRDYNLSHGNVMLDWDRAFCSWLRNSLRFNKNKGSRYDKPKSNSETHFDFCKDAIENSLFDRGQERKERDVTPRKMG